MDYDAGTFLIVVDVQNDFADPKGTLHVPGGEEVVPVVNREIDRAVLSSRIRRTGIHPIHLTSKGRRHLVSPLRQGDLGGRASSRPEGRQ